jgi:hypothetical protein
MYLAMTQQDFEDVIDEAPRIVATRLGLSVDQEQAQLLGQIRDTDPLAAGLLEKFIEAYEEWWTASCQATQGGPDSTETAKVVRRLIDKRGQMRSALISYLNSQHPTPCDRPANPESPARIRTKPSGQAWKSSISQVSEPSQSDAGIGLS